MSKEQWIWRCDRVIPNDTAAGRHVLEELLEQMSADRWVKHDVYSVRLAVEEALVNAVVHGNRSEADKHVCIGCRLAPNVVRIEITDQGKGFDPTTVPDPTSPDRLGCPRGRGVMLIKAFMSRIKYNATGNVVVMEKDRTFSPG